MRKRDYKREYQRRKQRAQAAGYRGYYQQRKARVATKRTAEELAKRMDEIGLLDEWWQASSLDELLSDESDALFWELFRNYYARGNAA